MGKHMNTVHVGDNCVKQLNFGDAPIGKVVRVQTGASTWYFCRVEGSRLDYQGLVTNVMIMTNSRTWGQQLHGPLETAIDATIEVGSAVTIKVGRKDAGATGFVRSVEYV